MAVGVDAEFTRFVEQRYAPMARAATLLAGSPARGEDLLQEALLRAFTHWGGLRDTGAAEAWVRTTMVRLLLHDRRRRWSGEVPTAELPEPANAGADPASAETVRAALRALPEDQRAAIVLRYYLDMSEAETAAALGCAPGTVKSRVSRAMATLRASHLLADEPALPGGTP
jgi:RNA polymerase sigma-70 factor (sigma-E family)